MSGRGQRVDVCIAHTVAYLLQCPRSLVPEAMRVCKFTLDESENRPKQMTICSSLHECLEMALLSSASSIHSGHCSSLVWSIGDALSSSSHDSWAMSDTDMLPSLLSSVSVVDDAWFEVGNAQLPNRCKHRGRLNRARVWATGWGFRRRMRRRERW